MDENPRRILTALMVLGVQSPEKALSAGELATKLGLQLSEAAAGVEQLLRSGYAQPVALPGPPRVYLTGAGIISASSTYS